MACYHTRKLAGEVTMKLKFLLHIAVLDPLFFWRAELERVGSPLQVAV